jgi:hypothetical protein
MKNSQPISQKRINLLRIMAIILLASLTPGCATIISGTHQELKFQPADAQFEVYEWDGKQLELSKNASDTTVSVHRPFGGHSYLVRMQKDGHCPQYWLTSAKGNPVGLLNLPCLPCMFVDHFSGASVSIDPTEFHLNQKETQKCGS